MARLLLIGTLLATAFTVYSIVDCAVQPPIRHRGVPKPVWILIVILFPVLGGILWFAVGRVRASQMSSMRGPDDDPEFLSRLGSHSDQDERIRQLEEELAQLDTEDPTPPQRNPGRTGAPGATTAGSSVAPDDPPAPSEGDDDSRGQRGAVG